MASGEIDALSNGVLKGRAGEQLPPRRMPSASEVTTIWRYTNVYIYLFIFI